MTKRLLLLSLLLTICVVPASATTTQLVGTVIDGALNPVTGTACLKLPVNAVDTSTNRALSPRAVCFPLTNGAFPAFASVVPNDVIQPLGTYYQFKVTDQAGGLVFMANYVIPTGTGTFNVGTAIPTQVLTTNVSYLTPASLTGNNNFTGNNTFPTLNTGIILANSAAYPCTSFTAAFAAGGIVDARGCTGTQSVTTNPLPSPTKPGTLLLGNTTFQTTASWTLLQGMNIFGSGPGSPGFGPTLIQAVSGFPSGAAAVVLNGPNFQGLNGVGVDCNNQPNAIGIQVNDAEELTFLQRINVTGCPNIGIAIGDGVAGHAQNSGPYTDLNVVAGNATTSSGTIPINVNVASTSFRGIHGATVDFHSAAIFPTYCYVLGTPGTYTDLHAEGCTNGFHITVSGVTLANVQCNASTNTMTNCVLIDAGLQDVTVHRMNTTNSVTNLLTDNTNSVTLVTATEGRNLGFYSFGAGNPPLPLLTTAFSTGNVVKGITSTTGNFSVSTIVTPIAVASLPAAAAGNAGQWRTVNDSTAIAAEGQTCAGGGTLTAAAFSNGTVWKCF
jgi:hypothetical protein